MKSMNLSDRMKKYESVYKHSLTPRTPTIIRIDGKNFSSYLKYLKTPFHDEVKNLMNMSMEFLCNNIQNAIFGCTHSDEISILLNDWKNLNTQQTFNGVQNKLESISASMVTASFNLNKQFVLDTSLRNLEPAIFDSRVFQLPREEVTNYFIWRQKDSIRNSVSSYARTFYSHKQLQNKSCEDMKNMLKSDEHLPWENLENWKKYGTAYSHENKLDLKIPLFTKDRNYIEDLLDV